MQTNKRSRSSQVQSPYVQRTHSAGKYKKEDNRITLIILGVLCLLLPPVGALLTWRAQKVDFTIRAILSAAALASSTLIFFLLMRPGSTMTDIRPTPATPQTIGYSDAAAVVSATQIPAPPVGAVPAAPSATDVPDIQQSGELTDDTIVYAVTNNAASYHLYELCDQQENRRPLTLREALNEGLAPCEKCVGAMG